jgi:phosphate transport system substrate-binding protein
MLVWEAGFTKFHPDVVFANNFMTSSEGAMAGLYTGISDVAPAGDDAKITDRMPFYNTFRYLPLELSVATGGYEKRGTLWAIQIVVNKDNPLSKLTMEQLDGIFGSERTGGWDGILYTSKYARGQEKNIRTWGQLGLTGEWADKPIHTYGYVAPGFEIAFERKIFHWSDKWNENYREFVEAKEVTPDAEGPKVASERMLEELSKDKYGVAWAPVLHTKDYPQVKGVTLANTAAGPFVPLTEANVQNRTYPFLRDAYIYVNRPPDRPLDPKVKEFLRYILSRQGQQDILAAGMYYPLTPDEAKSQLSKLD